MIYVYFEHLELPLKIVPHPIPTGSNQILIRAFQRVTANYCRIKAIKIRPA